MAKKCVGKRTAAALLGVSVRMLERLLSDGQVPTVRIGRRVVIDVDDLDAAIAAWKIPSPGAVQ